MKTVVLVLPVGDEPEDQSIEVPCNFEVEELVLLRRYVQLIERIRSCTLLQRGMGGFQGFKVERGEMSFSAGECTDSELHELLHVIRPVTLEQEATSFGRIASVLGRRLEHEVARGFLKVNGRIYRDGEMSLFFQVEMEGQPLLAEGLLRTWLNGTQYHTDAEKAKAWQELEATLGSASSRALVVAQLHSKVSALLNVDYIARQVLAVQHDA